jgi:hypothetical protein
MTEYDIHVMLMLCHHSDIMENIYNFNPLNCYPIQHLPTLINVFKGQWQCLNGTLVYWRDIYLIAQS